LSAESGTLPSLGAAWRRGAAEEGADASVRLSAERVWIVDPLEGTREFSELGRDDWAVHVAMRQAGELVTGAVALPAQGITLATRTVSAAAAAPEKAAPPSCSDGSPLE
jgi:3'(2'), 5'-bisphosphate nucleotidase